MLVLKSFFFSTDDTQDSPPPKKARIKESRLEQDQPSTCYSSLQYEEPAESGKGIESLMG